MKKTSLLLHAALILALPGAALAGDAAAGKAKSTACAACHGANGISKVPTTPNLAGQHGAYLAKAIKDYRDGVRKDVVMAAVLKNLSDADADNLAAYYSGLK